MKLPTSIVRFASISLCLFFVQTSFAQLEIRQPPEIQVYLESVVSLRNAPDESLTVSYESGTQKLWEGFVRVPANAQGKIVSEKRGPFIVQGLGSIAMEGTPELPQVIERKRQFASQQFYITGDRYVGSGGGGTLTERAIIAIRPLDPFSNFSKLNYLTEVSTRSIYGNWDGFQTAAKSLSISEAQSGDFVPTKDEERLIAEDGTYQYTFVLRRLPQKSTAQAIPITIDISGEKRDYLVLPDTNNPLRWYYVRRNLEFAEVRVRDVKLPDLLLVRHQRVVGDELSEGATLSFALDLKQNAEAATALAKELLVRSLVLRKLIAKEKTEPGVNDILSGRDISKAVACFEGMWSLGFDTPLEVLPLPISMSRATLLLTDPNQQDQIKRILCKPMNTASSGVAVGGYGHFQAELNINEAELVQAQLLSAAGVRCELECIFEQEFSSRRIFNLDKDLYGSFKPVGPLPERNKADDVALPWLDPIQITNDWLDLMATRKSVNTYQRQLIEFLRTEWDWAIKNGYQPSSRDIQNRWDQLNSLKVDSNAESWNFDSEKLPRLAMGYLLHIYSPRSRAFTSDDGALLPFDIENLAAEYHSIRSSRKQKIAGSKQNLRYLEFFSHYPTINRGLRTPLPREMGTKFGNRIGPQDLVVAYHLFEGYNRRPEDRWSYSSFQSVFRHDGLIKLNAAPNTLNKLIRIAPSAVPAAVLVLPDARSYQRWGLDFTEIQLFPRIEFVASTAAQKEFASQLETFVSQDSRSNAVNQPLRVIKSESDDMVQIIFPTVRLSAEGVWESQPDSEKPEWIPLPIPAIVFSFGESITSDLIRTHFLDAEITIDHRLKHVSDTSTKTTVDSKAEETAKPLTISDVRVSAFKGDRLIPDLTDYVDVVNVDLSSLTWNALSSESSLKAIHISFRQGGRQFSQSVRPTKNASGVWQLPSKVTWPIQLPLDRYGTVVPRLEFEMSNGSKKQWNFNDKPDEFHDEFRTLNVRLLNTDWKS